MELAVAYRSREKTSRVILHDSHTVPGAENIIEVMASKGRVMGLLEIGYHAIIRWDGTVVETRPMTAQGSHTPGYNLDSIGVLLEGGVDLEGNHTDNFSEDQFAALAGYLDAIRLVFGAVPVVGHTELHRYKNREHSCPALNMDWLRSSVLANTHPKEPPVATTPIENHKTHKELVLEYLKSGRTLTNMVALTCLGVQSLTSRVAELRRELGEDTILGVWATDRFDRKYIKYTYAGEANAVTPSSGFGAVEA